MLEDLVLKIGSWDASPRFKPCVGNPFYTDALTTDPYQGSAVPARVRSPCLLYLTASRLC